MHLIDRILKGQLGMTITEMVIATAIGGAAAMGAASLLGGIGGSSRDAELVIEKTQFASSLGVYLNSSFGCTELKSAVVSGANFTEDDQDIKLDQWKYRGVPVWKNDTRFSDKFKDDLYLKKLTAKIVNIGTPPTVTMTYMNDAVPPVEVTEQLKKTLLKIRAVLVMNSREYPHEFNIPVLMTATNDLRFCGDNRTMAET